MTRFQLVFQNEDGEQSELRDNNHDGEPHIDGRLIIDGETYAIRGVEWIIRSDGDHSPRDAMKRFVCTLAVEPAASDGDA